LTKKESREQKLKVFKEKKKLKIEKEEGEKIFEWIPKFFFLEFVLRLVTFCRYYHVG
jgi:hypothetical protein